MKILFRFDARPEIGLGHFMRCTNLAEILLDYGHQVYFLMNKDAPMPSNPKINVAYIDPKVGLYKIDPMLTSKWLGHDEFDDALQTLQFCKSRGIHNVIADNYALGFDWSNLVVTNNIKLIFLNELNDRQLNCTALIDATFGRKTEHYCGFVGDSCELMCGEGYSILNKNYLKFENKIFVINQNIGKIMICFGGSDRNNLTEICTDHVLKIYKDVEITVIIGKMNTRKTNLKSKYSQNPRINFLYDVSDMWNWYSKSDICIGGGGTMCGERAYIGVPSLIISTAKNQLGNAEYLHNASAAVYVGHWENGSLIKNLSANLDSLFSRERRLLLSINGRRLLGRNPTKQVIDKINEIFT